MMSANSVFGSVTGSSSCHGLYEYLNCSLADIHFRRSQNQFKCIRILSLTVPGEMFRLFVFLTCSPDFYQQLLMGLYLTYIFIPLKERNTFRQRKMSKTTLHMPSCFIVSYKLQRKQNTLINVRKAKRAVFSKTILVNPC